MAHSSQFKILRKRLAELRRHMLPAKFDPTGIYDCREMDRVRGYAALVHAEFEEFLEERCRQVVLAAIAKWKSHQKLSTALFSFVCCYQTGWKAFDWNRIQDQLELARGRKKTLLDINEVIDLAAKQYVSILGSNHGIKQDNLRQVLMPAGVNLSELDPLWLVDINDFGEQRGKIVHQGKNGYSPDPKILYTRVKSLFAGLGAIDLLLEAKLASL